MLTLTNGVRPETLSALLVDRACEGLRVWVRLENETDAVQVCLVPARKVQVGWELADQAWDGAVKRATVLDVEELNEDRVLTLTTCRGGVQLSAGNLVAVVVPKGCQR
jgi:hypothetical protein